MQQEHCIPASRTWIYSKPFDLTFIIGPAFFVTALVLTFPRWFSEGQVSLTAWVLLVLCIDVSHVYSTLYRTYFDRTAFRERATLYILIPVVCWLVGVLLYSLGAMVFWRVLAYTAVFHFVRQQYGFLRLYQSKGQREPRWSFVLDTVAMYAATIYPLLYWHLHPRNFSWFLPGDFFRLHSESLAVLAGTLYLTVLLCWGMKQVYFVIRRSKLNAPKSLIILGTILSWYVGIVLFNGDLVFTVTNVVSHGVPYMALIWAYGRKRYRATTVPMLSLLYGKRSTPIFLGFLIVLAYMEEAFWDRLVWSERATLFAWWLKAPPITDFDTLAWLIPLLAVPQATHYVLDGFIWKVSKPDSGLKSVLESA